MNSRVKFGVYKLLLELGVKKEDIQIDAALSNIIPYLNTEWNCFLFFLESKYNIRLNEEDEQKLITVENTVEQVQHHLGFRS
jgi:acyl carrier protein